MVLSHLKEKNKHNILLIHIFKTTDLNRFSQSECDGIKRTPFLSRLVVVRFGGNKNRKLMASAIKAALQVDDETGSVAAELSASRPP